MTRISIKSNKEFEDCLKGEVESLSYCIAKGVFLFRADTGETYLLRS